MTRRHGPFVVGVFVPLFLLSLVGCKSMSVSMERSRLAGGAGDAEYEDESYAHVPDNDFKRVIDDALSTFSVDVDTASYSNVRRFLADGLLPPIDAVRIEEMINYFNYSYAEPPPTQAFAVQSEVAACPWNPRAKLVQIGIKGRTIAPAVVPPRNLVFLLDVSGSMMAPDKLPLLKRSLALLVDELRPQDSVALVVYAGTSGVVLPPTDGARREVILAALERLEAGGSTNGGAGIERAYALAQTNFRPNGINRVILATDGDFNVGTTSLGALEALIEKKRASGVYLSVFGFGSGDLKDSTMESLADRGNGNYAYIDGMYEARKVLVEQAGGTLVTIARDVKVQVEFNPARVGAYRLIGYENRMLAHRDFNDDTRDAGEIGAGHTVTALYEVLAPGDIAGAASVDPLKYQQPANSGAAASDDLMTVKLRFKPPAGETSELVSLAIADQTRTVAAASDDLRFAAAVAMLGMKLRGSKHTDAVSFIAIRELASAALGPDPHGHRRNMLTLVDQAAALYGSRMAVAQP